MHSPDLPLFVSSKAFWRICQDCPLPYYVLARITTSSVHWCHCGHVITSSCSDSCIEQASFSPLVLSATGGLAREATTFYKRLASMLSSKCRLTFSLLRSSIQAIRGSRSSCGHPFRSGAIDLVMSEAHLHPHFLAFCTLTFHFALSFYYVHWCCSSRHLRCVL